MYSKTWEREREKERERERQYHGLFQIIPITIKLFYQCICLNTKINEYLLQVKYYCYNLQ